MTWNGAIRKYKNQISTPHNTTQPAARTTVGHLKRSATAKNISTFSSQMVSTRNSVRKQRPTENSTDSNAEPSPSEPRKQLFQAEQTTPHHSPISASTNGHMSPSQPIANEAQADIPMIHRNQNGADAESADDSDAPEEIPQTHARATAQALHHSHMNAHRDLHQRRKARRRARAEEAERAAAHRAETLLDEEEQVNATDQDAADPVLLPDDVLNSADSAVRQAVEDERNERLARRMQEQRTFIKPVDDARMIGNIHVKVAGHKIARSAEVLRKSKRSRSTAVQFLAGTVRRQTTERIPALKAARIARKQSALRR